MAFADDLINFDIIEAHKENIAIDPRGRSARQLVSVLSPHAAGKDAPPSLDETKTLNDAIRQEYEIEIQSIDDSDDPLDIYDRYVKWTLNAYPSAQATPQSQLLPLLERATKPFLSSTHYKDDPRYLKLWLHYIRLFSDAPRETFAFLARHHIGEGLGLFYEEFAAWLETAGRWSQADEVFRLGLEREARPAERLMRKYNQFRQRLEVQPQEATEPSSPALPTVRPALAAKVDPFASVSQPENPQQRPGSGGIGSSTMSRSGKSKMAIFSDAESSTPPALASTSNGWDNIGSIKDRKKENSVESRPWTGETLKAGKKISTGPKMDIFKDPTLRNYELKMSHTTKPVSIPAKPRSGRSEQVFVKLEAIYPNDKDEYSFEELRAIRRGWMDRKWRDTTGQLKQVSGNKQTRPISTTMPTDDVENLSIGMQKVNVNEQPSNLLHGKPEKQKRPKVREIKQEPQTVKLRLESPTGPKLKRKNSAEPTMTFHSKAATDEIYSIFNQPTKEDAADGHHSEDETDLGDDGYSTAGESTGTGRLSQNTSEYGGDDTMALLAGDHTSSQPESISPWSEFTASKHVPKIYETSKRQNQASDDMSENITSSQNQTHTGDFDTQAIAAIANQDFSDLNTRVIAAMAGDHIEEEVEHVNTSERHVEHDVAQEDVQQFEVLDDTRYMPLPPEDYEPTPLRPFRDPELIAQNRLPFMTPIVERTESSLAPSTAFGEKEYTSKTPCRHTAKPAFESPSPSSKLMVDKLLLESPQQENSSPSKRKLLDLDATNEDRLTASPLKKLAPSSVKQEAKIPFSIQKTFPTTADVDFRKPVAPSFGAICPIVKDLQCNPCEPSVREQILKSIHPSPESEPGYFDRTSEECRHYSQLQNYAKQVVNQRPKFSPRKSQSEKTLTKSQPPILKFSGTPRFYAVKKLLGKGAFAPVYLVDSFDPDSDVSDNENGEAPSSIAEVGRGTFEAIKTDSPPQNSAWEFHILRLLRHRLGFASKTMQSIVLARECHLFRDECYLVLDYHKQGTLLDLVNLFAGENRKAGRPADGLDEVLAVWFAVELLRTVEDIHHVGILHGDLKADNCLVRFTPREVTAPYDPDGKDGWSGKGLVLIDFGRGIDTRMFDDKARFIADWPASQTDCIEIRTMKTWRGEIDWFGVAGVVHSLLFGKYIETVEVGLPSGSALDIGHNGSEMGIGGMKKKEYKLKEGVKRYWRGELWGDLFRVLINSGHRGGEPEVLNEVKSLRRGMEQWLVREGEREGRNLRKSLKKAEELVAGVRR